ncbi:MAG TPA: MYXO-CTERM sorting domain-containing protein, partial [Polyangia bacterium]|nr:MYXO-CTERM sorting domain-containing protein [Polyangia bacterium]
GASGGTSGGGGTSGSGGGGTSGGGGPGQSGGGGCSCSVADGGPRGGAALVLLAGLALRACRRRGRSAT